MDQDATSLGRDANLGLGIGNNVLDVDTAPLKRGIAPPRCVSAHDYCGRTAGWIKMPLSTEVDLGPANIVLNGDPAAPHFWPMSIVAKRSPISATADLLLYVSLYYRPYTFLQNDSFYGRPT